MLSHINLLSLLCWNYIFMQLCLKVWFSDNIYANFFYFLLIYVLIYKEQKMNTSENFLVLRCKFCISAQSMSLFKFRSANFH